MRTSMGHLWCDSDGIAGVCREKPVLVPCCPPHNPGWPSQTDVRSSYTECPNNTLLSKNENLHVEIYYHADVRSALLDAKENWKFFSDYLPWYITVWLPLVARQISIRYSTSVNVFWSNLWVAIAATSIVRSSRCWRIAASCNVRSRLTAPCRSLGPARLSSLYVLPLFNFPF